MENNTFVDTIEYLQYTLLIALKPSAMKVTFSWFLVVLSFFYDKTQQASLLSLFALVLIDFVTGIAAAKYNGDPIRSSEIKHTAIKLTAYFGVIAGAHLAESGLGKPLDVLDESVVAFFLLTELTSLLENVGKMGIDTPKGLINKLLDYKTKI